MSIQLSEENGGRIVVVTLSGKLVKEDYDRFVPEVDRLVKEHGKIRILMDMHEFHGWDAGALWEDTKFAFKHFRSIELLAIVGEKKWQKGMAKFCKPFTKAQVRYFDKEQMPEARAWLRLEVAVQK